MSPLFTQVSKEVAAQQGIKARLTALIIAVQTQIANAVLQPTIDAAALKALADDLTDGREVLANAVLTGDAEPRATNVLDGNLQRQAGHFADPVASPATPATAAAPAAQEPASGHVPALAPAPAASFVAPSATPAAPTESSLVNAPTGTEKTSAAEATEVKSKTR